MQTLERSAGTGFFPLSARRCDLQVRLRVVVGFVPFVIDMQQFATHLLIKRQSRNGVLNHEVVSLVVRAKSVGNEHMNDRAAGRAQEGKASPGCEVVLGNPDSDIGGFFRRDMHCRESHTIGDSLVEGVTQFGSEVGRCRPQVKRWALGQEPRRSPMRGAH